MKARIWDRMNCFCWVLGEWRRECEIINTPYWRYECAHTHAQERTFSANVHHQHCVIHFLQLITHIRSQFDIWSASIFFMNKVNYCIAIVLICLWWRREEKTRNQQRKTSIIFGCCCWPRQFGWKKRYKIRTFVSIRPPWRHSFATAICSCCSCFHTDCSNQPPVSSRWWYIV